MPISKRKLASIITKKLELPGFKPVGNLPGNSVFAVKSGEHSIRLGFQYNKVEAGFSFRGGYSGWVRGYKRFPEIDSVIEKHCAKHNIHWPDYTISARGKGTDALDAKEYYVYHEEDVDLLVPHFKEAIEEDILPFFARVNTIEELYSHFLALKPEERADFFIRVFVPRIMVLKALFREPDFEEYCVDIVNRYFVNPDTPLVARQNAFLPDLFEELKTIYSA